jgi:hypothetical protein
MMSLLVMVLTLSELDVIPTSSSRFDHIVLMLLLVMLLTLMVMLMVIHELDVVDVVKVREILLMALKASLDAFKAC